jgi:Protein of unknown function (DUF732)
VVVQRDQQAWDMVWAADLLGKPQPVKTARIVDRLVSTQLGRQWRDAGRLELVHVLRVQRQVFPPGLAIFTIAPMACRQITDRTCGSTRAGGSRVLAGGGTKYVNYAPALFCGCNDRNISNHCIMQSRTSTRIGKRSPLLLLSATRLVVVVAALLGPLGAASTAHADDANDTFLAILKREGITDHVSPAHAIEAGHKVCEKLEQGMTPTEVAYDVLNSSSLPAYHSGYFVGASIRAYCPQYTPQP